MTLRAPIFAAALAALAPSALAHNAPAGWSYDIECCAGYDCAPVPAGAVVATADGYAVTLHEGDHPLVIMTKKALIPYGSEAIRQSGDEHFHVCIVSGEIRCIYVPHMGA